MIKASPSAAVGPSTAAIRHIARAPGAAAQSLSQCPNISIRRIAKSWRHRRCT